MLTQLVTSRGLVPTALEAMRMGAQTTPEREYERLRIILAAATEEEALETIAFMFKILPMENSGDSEDEKDEIADAMTAAYLLAVRGYPKWAIREARDAFIAGRVEGYTSSFAPRPPDLGREVARRCDEMHAKMNRMRREAEDNLKFRREERTGPRSPELKALGDAAVARLRAAAEQERRRGQSVLPAYADPNPITMIALEAAGIPDAKPRGTGALQKMAVPDAFDMRRAG